MHILHIYKDYYPVLGGMENHIKALSEGLIARGHHVTVLVTSRGPHDEVITQGALTIIKAGRLFHTASTPLSATMLLHARRLAPDVVNLHFPYPPGDLAYAAVRGQPPLVVTYQSDIVRQRALLQLYRPLLRHTLDQASRIIVASPNYVRSSPWLRPRADRCTVVPLSVDAARFAHPAPSAVAALHERYGKPLLLFVGRLRYYKGLHVLMEAMPHIPAKLLLAGTGPEEERLRSMVGALNIADRVFFAGDVSDEELPAYYAASDLYVLPAHLRSEAFGISLLEAQASGLSLVTTELGTGTSFANHHGETGFVVPPNNARALARAINVLLANPDLRAHMGEAGRRRAHELFSPERMVAATEQVFQEVVEEARNRNSSE